MKPLIHARGSVRRYGGVVEDYLPIHNFIDSSKQSLPDMRHRIFLHNSFGIYLAETLFGVYIINSDKKQVSVRDIAEDHVIEDLGFIPTLEKCVESIPLADSWIGGRKKVAKQKTLKIDWNTD